MIPGFTDHVSTIDRVNIAYSRGGEGPPLLMLHGFPQNRALWARVAPELARNYTVICADLRGYGDSDKPATGYSFRDMGADQLGLMAQLGFDQFHLIGHDRGGRTAHRMALDAPDRVLSLTVMDIVPTHHLLSELNTEVATSYYHWFFLAQPAPLPERLIGADPVAYYESCVGGWGASALDTFDPDQLAAYRASWQDPDTIRGMCADYRETLSKDMALDTADLGQQVTCPALVLYGETGSMAHHYNVPATWADRLSNMRSQAIPGGHFFIDQYPIDTATALSNFLNDL